MNTTDQEKFDFESINRGLLDFLDESPNAFFAVKNMQAALEKDGFCELLEGDEWCLTPGGKYYVTRNGSAMIAFKLPKEKAYAGFQIMASHADSPVFKVKTNAEIEVEKQYIKLNTERYGGMILSPWFDRPLSVAGRVIVETENGIETRLVKIDQDLLIIPNLAIHMERTINDGYKYNAQKDLLPLLGGLEAKGGFENLIADAAGCEPEAILDTDLFLYNRMKGTVLGLKKEFIASGRLDDLQCAYASMQGLIQSTPKNSVAVHCVYDNEEVGSGTKQGAASTFLSDVLHRINDSMGKKAEDYRRSLASSFMVSADNAHAVHPNYGEKADPTNRPYMNQGIVIKYSANQKYTTDAVSGAIFRKICQKAGVPCQTFANRSDMIGGSTLGNISQAQVALNTVDIGLPQLSMHSPYETAGAKDTAYLIEAAKELFSATILSRGDGQFNLTSTIHTD